MKRREFLKLGTGAAIGSVAATAGLLSWQPRAYAQTITTTLYAVKGNVTMIDGTSAWMFSYTTGSSPTLPGPTIVCQAGDTVSINLHNTLGTAVALKVGGISTLTLPNGTTAARLLVSAGANGSASFVANNPGTYLYYDDQNSGVNRIMGLYGALVVMPSGIKNQSFVGGPTFKRQYKWVFSSVDPAWGLAVKNNGDNYVASINTASFKPYYFLINGNSFENSEDTNTKLEGLVNEAALVRILNAGGIVHSTHFHGNHVNIVSINRQNISSNWKKKDIVSMFPLDVKDVILPFETPPDAWPVINSAQATSPLNRWPQDYPMHCHTEVSQTAGGGLYPHGLHTEITIGTAPAIESDLQQAVAALP